MGEVRKRQNQRKLGSEYEHIAGTYLQNSGFVILEYNWHCRSGEMDLIAKDGEYLVFCEVKYRKTMSAGHPLEAVNRKKQRVISKCANVYITQNQLWDVPCRFDVIGILGESPYELTHIENAFDYIG